MRVMVIDYERIQKEAPELAKGMMESEMINGAVILPCDIMEQLEKSGMVYYVEKEDKCH